MEKKRENARNESTMMFMAQALSLATLGKGHSYSQYQYVLFVLALSLLFLYLYMFPVHTFLKLDKAEGLNEFLNDRPIIGESKMKDIL